MAHKSAEIVCKELRIPNLCDRNEGKKEYHININWSELVNSGDAWFAFLLHGVSCWISNSLKGNLNRRSGQWVSVVV